MSATLDLERETASELLLDRFLPVFDVTAFNHIVVDAEPRLAYQAVHDLDLAETARESAALRGLMGLRGLPDTVRARLRGERPAAPPSGPVSLASPHETMPGWVLLGEEPGRELAVGAIGVFWTPSIRWLTIAPEEFASFEEPGYGKIAWSFSVLPYGARRALVTTECRTQTTDPESRARFLRYWKLVGPFASHVIRANLPVIKRHAEAAVPGTATRP